MSIDIVSDVMCPWCVVGYLQLERALSDTGLSASIRWHPFELNPDMVPHGQNLSEHIQQKYGLTADQSAQNRARLNGVGKELGFTFVFRPESRIVNTFAAHQLLDWAEGHNMQHSLKMALFEAHFSQEKDVSDPETLVEIAGQVGLDAAAARLALQGGTYARSVREKQQFWASHGISGVPAMVFQEKYLLTGAQGVPTYTDMLRQIMAETSAA
jgi:predicted DsbA family dithiol-disulfide isomerase